MLLSTDFTGYFKIVQDNRTAEILTAYIARCEQKYLVELFGFTLYELFIADLDVNGVPQTERFETVYNQLYYAQTGEQPFYPIGGADWSCFSDNRPARVEPTLSKGIREMLKGFIYFEFVNEYSYEVAQTGVVTNANENSTELPGSKHVSLIESRYNDAANSFKVIRNYMIANEATYPEYAGVEKDTTYWGGAF